MLEQLFRKPWSAFLAESILIRRLLGQQKKLFLAGAFSVFLVDVADLTLPLVLKEVVDLVVGSQGSLPQSTLLMLTALFFGVSAVQAIGRYYWRLYIFEGAARGGHSLREQLIQKLFKIPPSQFDRLSTGKLMSLATNDIEAVRMAIGSGSVMLVDALFYLAIIPVAMWSLSPQLTVVALIPLPLIPIYVFWAKKRIQQRFDAVQKEFSELSDLAQDGFAGIRTLKGLSSEREHSEQFNAQSRVFLEKNVHLSRIQSTLGPTLDFIMSTSLVLLLYVGSKQVLAEAITLGTWIAFQRYIQKLIWPLTALAMSVNFYQRGVASSKRLMQFLGEREIDLTGQVPHAVPGPRAERGRIEFRRLTFQYPNPRPGAPPALRNLQLTIEPGEKIALIGPIGSGKSTLLSLIPGLYEVERGQLFVDGLDVRDWDLNALREGIGFVGQDIFLFNESIEDNLGAEHAKLWTPKVTTDAREWNLTSAVGEKGVRLSGGQRQRIALARALSKQPPILLLDDAFSSVDTVTESYILEQIQSRKHRGTEILSAHRIATLRHCDRVVVLNEGNMVQMGSHQQLIQEKRGLYYRFYEYSAHRSV